LDAEQAPSSLAALGVRLYPDGRHPRTYISLAAARRAPRAMRRNRDRYLRRRQNVLGALTRFALMPAGEAGRRSVAALDPYELRARALRERLADLELGRVLFHLNQSRGFKSNRKLDRASNESGLIRDTIAETLETLRREGHETLGSWLAARHQKREGVRVRLAGSGRTAAYPFYPSRALVEHEFDTIWAAQSGWNPRLTAQMGADLRAIIFHQRPLKPVPVGRCWLEPAEPRAPRALPTAQRARIAQTLAHLRVAAPGMPERPLSDAERRSLMARLYRGSDLDLDRLRRDLGLPPEADINFREDKIKGCDTAHRLGARKLAGPAWHALPLAAQDHAVLAILEGETDEQTKDALIALGLPSDAAARVATAALADGHAALSAKALARILPHLEAGLRYSDAVQAAGYRHHSDTRTGEVRERLPYYGELLAERIGTGTADPADPEERRLGRAPNPTVHVALNEIRRVVNDLIDRFGPPAEIVVETLRDLGRSKKQREVYEREQNNNRKANDERRALLAEMGMPANARNLMRLRLWEEQATDPKNRLCPYSGTLITARTALSDAIEEDHILPFAVTLDDGAANRILVTRDSNRAKARRTPHQAFGASPDWPAILERASLLPPQKRWRFGPDALEKLSANGDFLARHLTDSAIIARWAVLYLEILAPGRVWSSRGRITEILRRALGLSPRNLLGKGEDRKSRFDQRHHAIDAVAVALTDRALLQRLTRAAQRAAEAGERLIAAFDPPWPGFHDQLRAALAAMIVSYKPDTGWQGRLHNDTAYGAISGARPGEPNVVVR
ncbi:MAG: type II CRISPR RNA-guided endonuclease Cas9, partial [Acetobacteraceae bacterium]